MQLRAQNKLKMPGSGTLSVLEASETDAPGVALLSSGASDWTPASATSPIISPPVLLHFSS